VNWAFKTFAEIQISSQYTENKSIYLAMNKFIFKLFMYFKAFYLSWKIFYFKIELDDLQAKIKLIYTE